MFASQLKQLADPYAVQVQVKGGSMYAPHELVIITTNHTFVELFPDDKIREAIQSRSKIISFTNITKYAGTRAQREQLIKNVGAPPGALDEEHRGKVPLWRGETEPIDVEMETLSLTNSQEAAILDELDDDIDFDEFSQESEVIDSGYAPGFYPGAQAAQAAEESDDDEPLAQRPRKRIRRIVDSDDEN